MKYIKEGKMAQEYLRVTRSTINVILPELQKAKISLSQFWIMQEIKDSSAPLCMSDIAKKMNHSTAAATGMIKKLKELGYVKDLDEGHVDGRKVVVCLDTKGFALIDRCKELVEEAIKRTLSV